jgi:hypothetical protein
MGYLIIVALIQAFSFSLIGEYLAGHVDSYFAVLAGCCWPGWCSCR